jgi:hypothetical protein
VVHKRFADRDSGGPRPADVRPAHDDPRRHRDRIGAARPPRPAPRRSGRGAARRGPATRCGRGARLPVLRRRQGADRPAVRERRRSRGRLAAASPRKGADPPPRSSGSPRPRTRATVSTTSS